MEADFLAAKIVLAAIFATAGTAKILDRAGSAKTLLEFGLPRALTTPFGILVSILEIVLPPSFFWLGPRDWEP